eukprot:s5134_g7.t1
MAGVTVPPEPPPGKGPINGSSPFASHGGKTAGGANPHRTTAPDSNMLPRPTRVLFVSSAVFRPLHGASLSTGSFQKVAGKYWYYFANRSLWWPTLGPTLCTRRQQAELSAAVVAPLARSNFYMVILFCRKRFSSWVLTVGPSVLGAVCRPIQLCLEAFTVLLTVLQPTIGACVSAVDWPRLLQALLCWMASAGPFSCPIGTVLLAVLQEPFIGPSTLGAAGPPCLLQALPCWTPSAGPF